MGIFEDTHQEYKKLGEMSNQNLLGRRYCGFCEKVFWKNYHNQIYCSNKCRQAKKDKKKNMKGPIGIRFRILKRDGFKCMYCGKNPIEDKIKLQVDHIYPHSRGGRLKEENLITSCNLCNIGKTDCLINQSIVNKIKKRMKNIA